MPSTRHDLLSTTRTLLRWAFYLDVLLVLLLAVVSIGLWAGDPSRISLSGPEGLTPEQRVFAARLAVLGGLIACALGLPLLGKLLAIVDSARAGDPFVPENAARLRSIGGLLLASHVTLTIAVSLAMRGYLAVTPVSFTALLAVLMVFVLARIFETGARMRADLEGTV